VTAHVNQPLGNTITSVITCLMGAAHLRDGLFLI